MELDADPDGDLVFHGISPLHADTLMRIPDLLQSDDPVVRARLLPNPYDDDPDGEQHWRRYGEPELAHLFRTRAELVRGDLQSLAQDGPLAYTVRIRRQNAAAWLSSLNAARLALFAQHALTDADMERDPADLGDFDKELALVRIHIMAYMQELLLDAGI